MLRVGICSGDETILNFLHKMIEEQYGEQISVSEWNDAEKLRFFCEERENVPFDIVLIDIAVKKEVALELASKMKMLSKKVKIIFLAEYIENSMEIVILEPVIVLQKPISVNKLIEAIECAVEKIRFDESKMLVLHSKGTVFRVNASHISYLETNERRILIHQGEEALSVYMKLDEVEEKLGDVFLRCHHSYLINMEYIKTFSAHEIELMDGTVIPVSRPKSGYAKNRYLAYLGENL